MSICLNCGEKSEHIICSSCENIETIEKVCEKLIQYPYEELGEVMNDFSSELSVKSNIKLALFALGDYFEGDKREFYKLMSISKGTRVDKASYPIFYSMMPPLVNSDKLSKEEREMVIALQLNCYQSEYRYEEAEELASMYEELGQSTWNLAYALGEYYTYTRRYEKARGILEGGLKLTNNEQVKNILMEKLENCLERESGKKKAYVPATDIAKERYKELLEALDIEVALPKKRSKSTNEIAKENYPEAVETKNTNFNSFISFDLETTGFARFDEITEIGAVKVIDGKIVDKFTSLVYTSRKISKEIEELTGITQEVIRNAPTMDEVLPKFMEFVGDKVLVGYNVMSFDSRFLLRAGRKSGVIINNPFFDVLNFAKKINDKKRLVEKLSLNELCQKLGVTNLKAHRALSDAEATAKVYFELLKLEGDEKDNDSIDDMLDDMDDWL